MKRTYNIIFYDNSWIIILTVKKKFLFWNITYTYKVREMSIHTVVGVLKESIVENLIRFSSMSDAQTFYRNNYYLINDKGIYTGQTYNNPNII